VSSAPKGVRRAHDAYYTPDDLARACTGVLGAELIVRNYILEPHCGGGAFVRAAQDRWGKGVLAMDIDPACAGRNDADVFRSGDFLTLQLGEPSRPGLVIGNPPFRGAEAHVRHALACSTQHVAFLLRLAFAESFSRAPFWAEHPARKVWVMAKRPSFTGGATDSCAYGWFWWDKQHEGPTEMVCGWDWSTA